MGLACRNLEIVLGAIGQTVDDGIVFALDLVHAQLSALHDVVPIEISLGTLILPILIVGELSGSILSDLVTVTRIIGLDLDRAAVISLLDCGVGALSSLGLSHLQAKSILDDELITGKCDVSQVELGLAVPL